MKDILVALVVLLDDVVFPFLPFRFHLPTKPTHLLLIFIMNIHFCALLGGRKRWLGLWSSESNETFFVKALKSIPSIPRVSMIFCGDHTISSPEQKVCRLLPLLCIFCQSTNILLYQILNYFMLIDS